MLKKYTAFVISILLGMTVLLSGCSNTAKETQGPAPKPAVTVTTVKAATGNIIEMSSLIGKLKPNKTVNVAPKMQGRVKKVNFDVGDNVHAGDVLLKMDDSDIQNQIKSTQAALDMAQANYSLNMQKYKQAEADMARYKQLYNEGAVTQQQYEQAKLAASPDMVKLYKAQLAQAAEGYNSSKTALKNTTVTSPISGVVAARNINPGEMVAATMPPFTIMDNSNMLAEVSLTEDLLNKVKTGDKASVTVGGEDKAVDGVVDTIAPAANQQTGLFPVDIRIANKDGRFKAGMSVVVKLPNNARMGVVMLPKEAVTVQNMVNTVFTVKDGKAVRHVVKTGISDDKNLEIISGIKAGDEVIVKGQNLLSGGEKLRTENGGSN